MHSQHRYLTDRHYTVHFEELPPQQFRSFISLNSSMRQTGPVFGRKQDAKSATILAFSKCSGDLTPKHVVSEISEKLTSCKP